MELPPCYPKNDAKLGALMQWNAYVFHATPCDGIVRITMFSCLTCEKQEVSQDWDMLHKAW